MWQKLITPIQEFGLGAGLLYIADRALRRLSPKVGLYVYELMVQPIDERPLLPVRLTKNLTFAEIGPGHPDLLRMPARDDIKTARFAQGASCFAAYRKGDLIGYLWWCRTAYEEDEVRCTYVLAEPERAAFDFDFYILPEHRMGTAFMAVWHGANQLFRERGIHYSCSRMTRFNSASRRAHRRLGARCVGRAFFLQVGPLEIMISSLQPRAVVSIARSRRVRLFIDAPRS